MNAITIKVGKITIDVYGAYLITSTDLDDFACGSSLLFLIGKNGRTNG